MIEIDPLALAQIATDAAGTVAQGPPGGLPEPVPEFVTDVHGAIRSFLDGSMDRLGDAVSGLTPGGSGDAPGR
ncbi:MAG: hypothetical protein V5A46_08435 [Haloferacaceae archaeon]